jgi:hypothetical protein
MRTKLLERTIAARVWEGARNMLDLHLGVVGKGWDGDGDGEERLVGLLGKRTDWGRGADERWIRIWEVHAGVGMRGRLVARLIVRTK